jgi:hypothetical protein
MAGKPSRDQIDSQLRRVPGIVEQRLNLEVPRVLQDGLDRVVVDDVARVPLDPALVETITS